MTTATDTITTSDVDTPVGSLRIAARGRTVVACGFVDRFDGLADLVAERNPDAEWVEGDSEPARALRAYVDGDVTALDGLDVETGGTEFQQRVWSALRTIPSGTTWSYRDLATATGSSGAVRAVGSANGANPVSVVIPCHRVIRSDGSLGGYGGGLERKAWLLGHEGARLRL